MYSISSLHPHSLHSSQTRGPELGPPRQPGEEDAAGPAGASRAAPPASPDFLLGWQLLYPSLRAPVLGAPRGRALPSPLVEMRGAGFSSPPPPSAFLASQPACLQMFDEQALCAGPGEPSGTVVCQGGRGAVVTSVWGAGCSRVLEGWGGEPRDREGGLRLPCDL